MRCEYSHLRRHVKYAIIDERCIYNVYGEPKGRYFVDTRNDNNEFYLNDIWLVVGYRI